MHPIGHDYKVVSNVFPPFSDCTVPKAISRLEMFYNTPRKYPRYSLKFFVVHFLLKYLETFRDIGALLCGGGGGI